MIYTKLSERYRAEEQRWEKRVWVYLSTFVVVFLALVAMSFFVGLPTLPEVSKYTVSVGTALLFALAIFSATRLFIVSRRRSNAEESERKVEKGVREEREQGAWTSRNVLAAFAFSAVLTEEEQRIFARLLIDRRGAGWDVFSHERVEELCAEFGASVSKLLGWRGQLDASLFRAVAGGWTFSKEVYDFVLGFVESGATGDEAEPLPD